MSKRQPDRADPLRVVAYLRTSTSAQDIGPRVQLAAIEAWCAQNDAELLSTHEDRCSGAASLDSRPGLLGALDALKEHGAGTLLAMKRDRIARDSILAAMLERLVERNGARLLMADGVGNGDGPEALLMRRMVDAFSEYERSLIRARTRSALQKLRNEGVTLGSTPMGKTRSTERDSAGRLRIVVDPEQVQTVQMICTLRAEGLTLRAIADRLTADGRKTQRGGRWWPASISSILNRSVTEEVA